MSMWDFLSARGENLIRRWAEKDHLSKRDRALLNQKLDRLGQLDFALALQTKLLAGPIHKQPHIYKLVIHGDVMLRPMLCRGPIDNGGEYTMLLGCIERDRRLPDGAAGEAEENRKIVIQDPARRCTHERL